LILAVVALFATGTASADDLIRDSRRALQQLMAQNPAAARAKAKAVAAVAFPDYFSRIYLSATIKSAA
jgi:hypothetical protein